MSYIHNKKEKSCPVGSFSDLIIDENISKLVFYTHIPCTTEAKEHFISHIYTFVSLTGIGSMNIGIGFRNIGSIQYIIYMC